MSDTPSTFLDGNFYAGNDDLRFYAETAIDWARLYEETKLLEGPEPMYESLEEAKEAWAEMLELVGELAAQEIAPHWHALDTEEMELREGEVHFGPTLQRIFEQIDEMGLHGMCLPPSVGGLGCPLMMYSLSAECIARADVSVMAHHGFHGGIALALLYYSAMEGSTDFDPETGDFTATRFQEAVEEIVAGEAWGSMDITEPDAGSDMGALRSVARQAEDGSWTVTGQKIFITSGHGRWHIVVARAEDPTAGPAAPKAGPMDGLDGLSLFLVEAYRPREDGSRERFSTIERLEEKLGHHASATVAISFEDSPAQLIGKVGEGFKQMLLLMNNARISVGFESIGLAEAALRAARDYAAVRRSMGKSIDKHEMIADMLDEMETDIRGLRALAVDAAFHEELSQRLQLRLKYRPPEDEAERKQLARQCVKLKWRSRLATPLLKYMASEKAVEIARRAIQIHGGSGYMTEYPVEKLLRDAMVLPIYEGTSQIQCLMATKDSLLGILKRPQAFAREVAETAWVKRAGRTENARRVADLRSNVHAAQIHLIRWIVQGKLGDVPLTSWSKALRDWDTKVDFAPALLHAEKLTIMLADLAIVERLATQAERWSERQVWLDRYLERAEPRSRFELDRIRSTGQRLLDQLAGEGDGPTTEFRAAK